LKGDFRKQSEKLKSFDEMIELFLENMDKVSKFSEFTDDGVTIINTKLASVGSSIRVIKSKTVFRGR